jgi:hypothetical protein
MDDALVAHNGEQPGKVCVCVGGEERRGRWGGMGVEI